MPHRPANLHAYYPADSYNQLALGAARYRSGRWEDAIAALEKVIEIDRRSLRASILLAMAFEQCGRVEKARKLYQAFIVQLEETGRHDEDLLRLRAEGEKLLLEPRDTQGNSVLN